MKSTNTRRGSTQEVGYKNSHSREPLSGIYNACCCYKKGKTLWNRCVEDPRYRHSGMTPNLMGFTLIELLVVVLIIGILAAVAVPQYQKAVKKSHATQAVTLLKSIAQAERVYYLSKGVYTANPGDLDITIPFEEWDDDGGWNVSLGDVLSEGADGAIRMMNADFRFVYYLDTARLACQADPTNSQEVANCKLFATEQQDCSVLHKSDGDVCFYLND